MRKQYTGRSSVIGTCDRSMERLTENHNMGVV